MDEFTWDEDVTGLFEIGQIPSTPPGDETALPDEALPPAEDEPDAEPDLESEDVEIVAPYALQELALVRLDGTALQLVHKPIPLRVIFRARFSRPIGAEERSLLQDEFSIKNPDGNIEAGIFQWNDPDFDELRFVIKENLDHSTEYSVRIAGADHSFTTMVKGDINGDGHSDLVIGEPGWKNSRGRVRVIEGAQLSQIAYLAILHGENAGDRFGTSVAIVGDVNGDGYEDVVVGAPYFDNTALVNAGKAYLYLGPDLGAPQKVLLGEAAGSLLGRAIAGCDINGDGFIDVLAGAPNHNNYKGRVTLLKGGLVPSNVSHAEGPALPAEQQFGSSIACLGSHDGLPGEDILIGSPLHDGKRGRISIHRGESLAQLTYRNGDIAGDQFGFSVAAISDLNGDRRNDILVGAPYWNSERGMVYVFRAEDDLVNASPIAKGTGEGAGHNYGTALMAIPDITGDGKQDVLIGAPKYNVTQGKIYAADVSTSNLAAVSTKAGDSPQSELGKAMALVPDLTGDGRDDLAVGEPGWQDKKGRVLLLKSAGQAFELITKIEGSFQNNYLGSSLSGR